VALFNWVKQHPAAAGSLGWLLVIDEAQNYAPATGITPSTSSTILLAQQARKYGLGLILATQAPKGVHNQVTGNARTQFFGLLNSGAHIQAARELAAAKGEKLTDIGKLKAGQFYVTNEDEPFTRVDMPLCLSYHAGALPPDEVIERARREP
jgi:DNA helicase HerA-like ATPase